MKEFREIFGGVIVALTRWFLPAAILIAGIVLIVIGHGRTGAAGVGTGFVVISLIVWMINWLFRMSLSSNQDREREELNREYFDIHGRWPDEDRR